MHKDLNPSNNEKTDNKVKTSNQYSNRKIPEIKFCNKNYSKNVSQVTKYCSTPLPKSKNVQFPTKII